jgi:hypothetical protein
MKRRALLIAAVTAGAGSAGLVCCGGSGNQSAPVPPPIAGPEWSITPAPVLWTDNPSTTMDLNPTLPTSVKRGGRFEVAPQGAPLPAGVVLSDSGVLSLTSSASPGTTTGVVFVYVEPT